MPFGPPNLWAEIATRSTVGRGVGDVDPRHRLDGVGVDQHLGCPLPDATDDLGERLDRADLVVDEHDRDDRGTGVDRGGDGVEVDDARGRDRQPGHPEALGGEAVARRQHALVLERGRDHAVAPPVGPGPAGRALHREVVGLGAAGGEHDLVGSAPSSAATSSRASSRAVFAARAAEWAPLGLPKVPPRNGSMASTASGRIGVVAA